MKEYIVKTVEVIGYILAVLAIFACLTGMIMATTFNSNLGLFIFLMSWMVLLLAGFLVNIRSI